MGRYEGKRSQCKVPKNLSIPLDTVNRVIVDYTTDGTKCTSSCSGSPGPLDPTLTLEKRNVEDNSRCKACDSRKC